MASQLGLEKKNLGDFIPKGKRFKKSVFELDKVFTCLTIFRPIALVNKPLLFEKRDFIADKSILCYIVCTKSKKPSFHQVRKIIQGQDMCGIDYSNST